MEDAKQNEAARRWGRALQMLRNRAGVSQEAAGAAVPPEGISAQAWGKYEAGKTTSIFQPATQAKLVAALGASVEDLVAEHARILGGPRLVEDRSFRPPNFQPLASPPTQMLPIRDRVQAGAWLMADDVRQDVRLYPILPDPRYPHAKQWMSEVVGDSVNRLGIFEGDLIHVIDAEHINYRPVTEDIVEVERVRYDGAERELTVKQVEVAADGSVKLWPRSTNERWQEPLDLSEGTELGEFSEVRIRGFVPKSIRVFR